MVQGSLPGASNLGKECSGLRESQPHSQGGLSLPLGEGTREMGLSPGDAWVFPRAPGTGILQRDLALAPAQAQPPHPLIPFPLLTHSI